MYVAGIFINTEFIITKIKNMPYIKFKYHNGFVYINYYLINSKLIDKKIEFFIVGKLEYIDGYQILTPKRIVALD